MFFVGCFQKFQETSLKLNLMVGSELLQIDSWNLCERSNFKPQQAHFKKRQQKSIGEPVTNFQPYPPWN